VLLGGTLMQGKRAGNSLDATTDGEIGTTLDRIVGLCGIFGMVAQMPVEGGWAKLS
jgi:hypothetical protein